MGIGSWMEWHTDEAMTDPPQLELVYTVSNSSDSVTRVARTRADAARGKVREIWTEPNSVLLVRAEGALHMVSPVQSGCRAIAKAVFAARAARRTEAWAWNL